MEIESSLSESITHRAEIIAIEPGKNVTLRILGSKECGGCPAAALCGTSGSTNEIVIPTQSTASYHIGQQVKIEGSEQLHRRAIRIATVYPTIAIIAVMTLVYLCTGNQAAAALAALATMLAFFIILWACRNKLAREFTFRIMT